MSEGEGVCWEHSSSVAECFLYTIAGIAAAVAHPSVLLLPAPLA